MTGEPSDRHALEKDTRTDLERRYFIGIAGGIGAAMLAGCSTRSDTGDASDDTDGTDDTEDAGDGGAANAGTFRLLISDQPVAIDEFDSLDVTFDHARIFREADDEDEEQEQDENGTESDDEEQDDGGTENGEEDDGGEKAEEEKEQRGFFTIDLEGSTVDLTRVVGDKAVSIFEGELSEGRYSKIELHAADVDGTVDGEPVAVKIPSEKLQIVKPFEVEAGGTLSFVFDINVVKKGQTGEYNLLPVISESGIDGEDVDVEEIEGGEGDESETEDGESTGAARGDGPPEDDSDGS
jgi:hypothetical protein